MTVVDVFSCISSGATALAAFVAVFALNAWRKQFRYQRKYECILDIRSQLHGANEAALYLSSLREHFSEAIRAGTPPDSLDAAYPYELHQVWWEHLSKLQRTWALLEITLDRAELQIFTVDPFELQVDVGNYVNEIVSLACAEQIPSLLEVHRMVSNSITSVEGKYKIMETQCRKALTIIK